MGYKLNGCDTGGFPFYLIKPLLEKVDIKVFVETGTAAGESAKLAATLFEQVYTIEIIKGRQQIKDSPSNIEFHTGYSVEILPEIINELLKTKKSNHKEYVLFWLDAHYSGNTTNETGYPECPLLEEIEAVAIYGEEALIIIDDARLFLGHPPYPNNPNEWPTIKEIFELLTKHFPYHMITITDDYILCMSHHVKDVFEAEWRERYHIRYPNAADKLRTQTKDVYNALLKYIQC